MLLLRGPVGRRSTRTSPTPTCWSSTRRSRSAARRSRSGSGATEAIVVLAAMVVLLATGIVPSVVAGLLAAGAMVLLRVVTVEGAYRAISGRRSCWSPG